MTTSKSVLSYIVLVTMMAFSIACQLFGLASPRSNSNSAPPPAETAVRTESENSGDSQIITVEDPVDLEMTAEEAFRAFKEDKSTIKGEKFVDKVIEIRGRFKGIDLEKVDTDGTFTARLNAGGMFEWVSCSVDPTQKDEFAAVKKDQMVTFKGLGQRFWIAGPRLKHCIVITHQ